MAQDKKWVGFKSVVTRRVSGKVLLSVFDREPGINCMNPKELLRPFVRTASSGGDRYGAGLGLAIADRIVRTHTGMLILSNREGGGLQASIEISLA